MDDNTPLIDLAREAKPPRQMGDITVFFTWSMHNGRPVMVLVPNRRGSWGHEDTTPCLVPMDLAYQWDEHTGDPAHCARMTFQFANALGLNAYEPRNLIRLTSIIREHLGDLLTIPPMPESEREAVADVILTDTETGKTQEMEIVDHV